MAFLENYWTVKTDDWLAQKLGVTPMAVKNKRRVLGLKRESPAKGHLYGKHWRRKDGWSEVEEEYMKMGYGKVSTKRMAKVLGRAAKSLCLKACRMGMGGSGGWIRDEYEILILDEVECAKFLELEAEIKK